jgi:CRP-like cAMP-binding protein
MDSPPDGPDDDSPTRPEVQSVREVLSKVGFLAHLQVEELEILLARMQKLPVVKGTVIINQDDLGADRFFIVVRGRCTVWVRQGQGQQKVADLGPGSFFGERALITAEARSATVKADEFSQLYVLSKADFDGALMHNPGIAEKMRAQIARYKDGPASRP